MEKTICSNLWHVFNFFLIPTIWWVGLHLYVLYHFQLYVSCIVAVSFIGERDVEVGKQLYGLSISAPIQRVRNEINTCILGGTYL